LEYQSPALLNYPCRPVLTEQPVLSKQIEEAP
jgi:hypothetical protein